MAYTKYYSSWQDQPTTTTPAVAAAFNRIEQGVADAHGQVFLDPTNDAPRVYEIRADGSSSAGWKNRWEWWYKAAAWGAAKLVQWINEYGEWRGMPALSNTVGWRLFAAADPTDYAARSTSVPIGEIVSDRTNRTPLIEFFSDGKMVVHGDLTASADLIVTGNLTVDGNLVVDGNVTLPGIVLGTAPSSPAVGRLWADS